MLFFHFCKLTSTLAAFPRVSDMIYIYKRPGVLRKFVLWRHELFNQSEIQFQKIYGDISCLPGVCPPDSINRFLRCSNLNDFDVFRPDLSTVHRLEHRAQIWTISAFFGQIWAPCSILVTVVYLVISCQKSASVQEMTSLPCGWSAISWVNR